MTVFRNHTKYRLLLIVVCAMMLCLELLDAPTLSDDMIYRFMWHADESAPVESINTLGDLLHSQWEHYQSTNGRWLVHLLAQAFLVFVPPVVLQVLNALLFTCLLHLSVKWVVGDDKDKQLFVGMMMLFLLFVVFQGFRTTMLWSLGAFNYLWVLVATMALIEWREKSGESSEEREERWLLSPLAFLVGCGHEALSVPVSAALLFWLVVNRSNRRARQLLPFALCYWLGTLTILLSPGIWNRSTEGISLMSRLVSGAVNLVFNMRVVWLLMIALLVLWRCKRALLKTHLQQHLYIYVALLVSVGIVTVCGTNLERVCFYTDFLAMLLLMRVLVQTVGEHWRRGLTSVACAIVLLMFVPAYLVRQENYDNWEQAETQMRQTGQELVAVRCPQKGVNRLLDYCRNHYVNPSVEFGFYCSYMAFDSSDINMRCAASLYGKERLTFLPYDVVRRIEADSTAFADYELCADGSLYVWRLKGEDDVSAVTFVLNPEDVSKLMPHQRLLAYRYDTYELDDFKYEVVQVGGRHYLVFTRPTTNIVRRLNRIELERSIRRN